MLHKGHTKEVDTEEKFKELNETCYETCTTQTATQSSTHLLLLNDDATKIHNINIAQTLRMCQISGITDIHVGLSIYE